MAQQGSVYGPNLTVLSPEQAAYTNAQIAARVKREAEGRATSAAKKAVEVEEANNSAILGIITKLDDAYKNGDSKISIEPGQKTVIPLIIDKIYKRKLAKNEGNTAGNSATGISAQSAIDQLQTLSKASTLTGKGKLFKQLADKIELAVFPDAYLSRLNSPGSSSSTRNEAGQLGIQSGFSFGSVGGRKKSRKLGNTFNRCVKSVRKTVRARKGSTRESAAIAICTKSVLQTRGKTLKRYRKGRLVTQKKFRGGCAGDGVCA